MAVLLAVFGLFAFVALIAWAVHYSKGIRQKLERTFADAAERTGGRFVPGVSGFFKNVSPSVTINRDGSRIFADTYVVSSGKHSTTYSRITAGFALGRGPELHIRRQHAFNALGKMLGMQDIEIGDSVFDEVFVIKGPSAAAVLRVLSRDHRLALVHQLPGWWIKSDGATVTVQRVGYPDGPGELATAIEVAAVIATADKRILDRAAAHPDARADGRAVTFAASGVEGRFSVDTHDCKLRVAHVQEGPEFALDCEASDAPTLLPEGALEGALAAQIRSIGPARLARDRHHVWVSWREPPAEDEIEAAWRVLVGLAAPSTRVGAFR